MKDLTHANGRVRKADERGLADFGWLKSRHSFSFGEYHDPQHMGFRTLRVINDDRVAPNRGFGAHPHRDMEIISYVVEGRLQHKDSMGNGSVIKPGDVQRMSAGTGVEHSEYNPSSTEPVHFLQIWIQPEAKGLEPSYEEIHVSPEDKQGRMKLIGSRDGRDGSITIHQDVNLYAAVLAPGDTASLSPADGRHVWIQIVSGSVSANGTELETGDGLALSPAPDITVTGMTRAEFLVFDLG